MSDRIKQVRNRVDAAKDLTRWNSFFMKETEEHLIIATNSKGDWTQPCVFTFIIVKKCRDDDDMSLLIGNQDDIESYIDGAPNSSMVYKKYLVTLENSGKLINKLLLNEPVNDLLYKNKPKIKSYGYGAQLHDISFFFESQN